MTLFARARTLWRDWPDTSTPVRAQDYNQWDQWLTDLKNTSNPGPTASGDTSGATDWLALQSAINTLPAAGGVITLPPGVFYINAAVNLNVPVTLRGAGSGSGDHTRSALTRIVVTSTTNNGLLISSAGCTVEDVALLNTSAAESAGAGISVTHADYMRLHRVSVNGFYDCLSIEAGIYYTVSKCYFLNPVRYGVRVQNTSVADAGDGEIEGCVITCGGSATANRNATAAIRWETGGGLRIIGNKINGVATTAQFDVGIDAAIADGQTTSDLFVVGNSIEAITTTGVQVRQQGTTGAFSNVIVQANEIAVGGFANGILCDAPGGLGYLSIFTINGNVIKNTATVGISLNSITQAVVSGNFISGSNAGSLIQITNCDTVDVQPNMMTGNVTNGFVYIASSATPSKSVSISRQNISSAAASQTLVQDNSSPVAAHLARARIVYDESRSLPGITSSVTYSSLYTLVLPDAIGCGGVLSFLIEGVVAGGVGPDYFAISGQRLLSLPKAAGSTVTATTIGADTVVGTAFDYAIDVATADTAILKARLNAAQGGTSVTGQAYVRYEGPLQRLARI